jgi:peptidoglycan hydrolase FlgJ
VTAPVSSTAPAAPAAGQTVDQKQLRAVAEQFEAVMLRQMIGSMRSASLSEGMFDNGGTEQFRDMSDARTAENMAKHGALGIADLLVKQFGARLAPGAADATVKAGETAK